MPDRAWQMKLERGTNDDVEVLPARRKGRDRNRIRADRGWHLGGHHHRCGSTGFEPEHDLRQREERAELRLPERRFRARTGGWNFAAVASRSGKETAPGARANRSATRPPYGRDAK